MLAASVMLLCTGAQVSMKLQEATFSFSALSLDYVLGSPSRPCQACSSQPLLISQPLGPQPVTASLPSPPWEARRAASLQSVASWFTAREQPQKVKLALGPQGLRGRHVGPDSALLVEADFLTLQGTVWSRAAGWGPVVPESSRSGWNQWVAQTFGKG